MLYIVEWIFLEGVSFDIVFNESFHEKICKKLKNYVFPTEFRNKTLYYKLWGCEFCHK